MRTLLLAIIILISFNACEQKDEQDLLSTLIQQDTFLNKIAQDPAHKVQIVYTQIDRSEDNSPSFRTHAFQLDTTSYFYPASTVKMPAAFMALEKINELAVSGLNKDSKYISGAATAPQTAVKIDTTKADSIPSIAHYIKKIFLVSDNDAYNRLYEFLGQAYFNDKLKEKGYTRSRIIHRLSVSGFDTLGNRLTNPVQFFEGDQSIYEQEELYSNAYPEWTLEDHIQGKAYLQGNEIIDEPFDFTYKNYVSLLDLHDMLQAVMFPEAVPEERRFNLSEEDYTFLYEYMSKLPRESEEPAYPKLVDWDDYVKFLVFGSAKERIPEHIKIFNKVGDAYGYLTDVAYVIDTKNKVEFMLAATIHVNENETFNDGVYEYDAIGFPFLGRLGKVIHEYEIKRERTHQTDFSRFLK